MVSYYRFYSNISGKSFGFLENISENGFLAERVFCVYLVRRKSSFSRKDFFFLVSWKSKKNENVEKCFPWKNFWQKNSFPCFFEEPNALLIYMYLNCYNSLRRCNSMSKLSFILFFSLVIPQKAVRIQHVLRHRSCIRLFEEKLRDKARGSDLIWPVRR